MEAPAPLPFSSFAAPGLPTLSLGPATHPPERVGTGAHPVRSPRLTPQHGSARVSHGTVPGGGDAVARRRLPGRSGVGGETHHPRCGPSPCPPPPGCTARPSAPPEGGSAINKRSSVARGPRSCCVWSQIAGSGRPGSRNPESPGRTGELSKLRLGPGRCHLARLRSRPMAPLRPPPPMMPLRSEGLRRSGCKPSFKD